MGESEDDKLSSDDNITADYFNQADNISVKTTTYLPHSNECGPHTLLALTIMGLHHNPDESMLIPFMHANIAQITCIWITNTLLLNSFDITPFQQYIQTQNNTANHECTKQSIPYNLFHILKKTSTQVIYLYPLRYQQHTVNPTHNITDIPVHYTNTIETDTVSQKHSTLHQWMVNRMGSTSTEHTHEWEPDCNTFGTPIQTIDPTMTLRIIAQNPQYSLQSAYENEEVIQTLLNLQTLQASIYAAISSNINFCNPSHLTSFKKQFRRVFNQAHVSATSCDIGLQPTYKNRYNLTGGVAIVMTNHWTSKICGTKQDPRGHGSFTVIALQGRNGKKLSIIAAYISVEKGTSAGINTVHAQQRYMMEYQAMQDGKVPLDLPCPRKEAVKAIGEMIHKLQEDGHAIILTIDANQTPSECKTLSGIKPYSIEWLCIEYGMGDPFIELCSTRPPSTTIHPNRDIDFVLTHGIIPTGITTLQTNIPSKSDHIGICIDINIEETFGGKYSSLGTRSNREQKYVTYVQRNPTAGISLHNLFNINSLDGHPGCCKRHKPLSLLMSMNRNHSY